MLEIDGSYGEGGGQLARSAAALAAITGRPIGLRNIRARRHPPGLAPQHLMAVRAVAQLCAAEVEGLAVGARELVFRPGRPRGGEFRFDVGTAGSLTLVLQAALPVALSADAPVHMRLTGGTDVRAAPPLDYLRYVLLPLLERLGARVKLTLVRRGYYPRGGGEIVVEVIPGALAPLCLEARGAIAGIRGVAHVANLPAHIAERMQQTAARILSGYANVRIERELLGRDAAFGPGGALVVWARCAHTVLGGGAVAQRGVAAERIAGEAAAALRDELECGAMLDLHAADQILIYLALARGASHFCARLWSSHADTTAWLIQQFLPVRITTTPQAALMRVDVVPAASRGPA